MKKQIIALSLVSIVVLLSSCGNKVVNKTPVTEKTEVSNTVKETNTWATEVKTTTGEVVATWTMAK